MDVDNLIDLLREVCAKYTSSSEAFQELGQTFFKDLITHHAPKLCKELESGGRALESEVGYFVIQNLGIEKLEPTLAELLAIAIGSFYGEPTKTDQKDGRIAWPIKYDAKSTQKNKTFSQTMGEAEFHTDTQYFDNPERYFGLFCIVSDEEGKGTNELVSGADIVDYIQKKYGSEVVETLKQPYPFRVPSVFTKSGTDNDIEVTWKPILNEKGDIRYRFDTIQTALESPVVSLSEEQTKALDCVVEAIKNIPHTKHHLLPGEAIFVNNHRLLHARTFFDNPDRFLYRVRIIPSHHAE